MTGLITAGLCRRGGTSACFAGEERAGLVDGAHLAFWFGAFAEYLTVLLKQQIGANACVEGCRDICCEQALSFVVRDAVVFAFAAEHDAD